MGKGRNVARFLAGTCLIAGSIGVAHAEIRSLNVLNVHTQERANVVFKRDGVYDQKGLQELNRLLRDWRRNEVTRMDPALFDLIWEVYRDAGASQPIHVVCGYRSPATNNMLRSRSRGVAKFSQHMLGKAMDFYLPGVDLSHLREVGMKKQVGGVGFYPTSGSPFVHMDTGSVRAWPRMTREQLVRLFPNGKTAHLPADGNPLPGYQQALAEVEARKAHGGSQSTTSSSSGGGLLAALFGGGSSSSSYSSGADEDEEGAAPAPKRTQVLRQGPLPTRSEAASSRDQSPPGVEAVPIYRSKPVQPQVRLAEVELPQPAPSREATRTAPTAALPTTTAGGSLVAMPISTPLPQPAPMRVAAAGQPLPSRYGPVGTGLPPGWVQGPSGQTAAAPAHGSAELVAFAAETTHGTPIAVPVPAARPGLQTAFADTAAHGTPIAVVLPRPRPGAQRVAGLDAARAFSTLTGEEEETPVALGYAAIDPVPVGATATPDFVTASVPSPARPAAGFERQSFAAVAPDPVRNPAEVAARFAAPPSATAAAVARAAARAAKGEHVGDETARFFSGKSDRASEARLLDGFGSAFGHGFAQLRHPDQTAVEGLFVKPERALAVGFGRTDVEELRVQRFTGPAIVALAILKTE